ncbi:UNVERIFIED_CONTAM: hypothetical protein FKN15_043357 [Acipenser sinensis]
MDRNALAELLQALESRRDAEERRREERYTALIERSVPVSRAETEALLYDAGEAEQVKVPGSMEREPVNPDRLTAQGHGDPLSLPI